MRLRGENPSPISTSKLALEIGRIQGKWGVAAHRTKGD